MMFGLALVFAVLVVLLMLFGLVWLGRDLTTDC
jgi:hypothetical protein